MPPMRTLLAHAPAGVLLASLLLTAPAAQGQTTDGYHQDQVFPVVVDTGSFAQRFSFRNPTPAALDLTVTYYPANGTTATKLVCANMLAFPADSSLTFTSLRALCPDLPSGSQFGFLRVQAQSPSPFYPAVFAGFSRVANPQGNGFAVEPFATSQFTAATSLVTGLRRLAKTGNAPAFQTNCFVGNLDENLPATPIHYTLMDAAGATIGSGDLDLAGGQFVRLLDVFAVAPAGDYDDASIRFEELGPKEPGVLAFCTVQDNTSFGADFRIAKQELADGGLTGLGSVIGPQDASASRETRLKHDPLQRAYALPAGRASSNEHSFYFRHPDYVACGLEDAQTGAALTAAAKLELQLVDWSGANAIAGGAGITAFGPVYLGDKTDRSSGSNTRYRLVVRDSAGADTAAVRNYQLHCRSGSGHTLGEFTRYQTP
jgi:hypothetical protein